MSTPDDEPRRRREHWDRRHRLERRLHDGAALRMSSLVLRLDVLRRDPSAGDVEALQDEVAAALDELRAVAGRIYPPLLHEAGLGPALGELVTASGADVTLDVTDDRCGPAAEGAAYFAVADVIAGSHGPLAVRAHVDGTTLVVGMTGADPALAPGVRDEAGPLGGSVDIHSEHDADTIIARFPCG